MINIPLGSKVGRILAISALVLFWIPVQAQFGAYERFAEVLANGTFNSVDDPIYLPPNANIYSSIVQNARHGDASEITSEGAAATEVAINYTPDPGFTGLDTVIVEVRLGGPPIQLAEIYFAQFVLHVVPSIITTGEDYYTVVRGSTATHLPVTSNDSSTAPGLAIQIVPALMGGVTTISNDSLFFTPSTDYQGMAYLTYVVCDSAGSCQSEVVNICVVDTSNIGTTDTIELVTALTDDLTEFLPSSNFYSTIEPQLGTLEFIPNTDAMIYRPGMSSGMDVFEVSDGNHIRYYEIDVLPDVVNSFVFDDYVSVIPGGRIEFNVKSNDRRGNFLVSDFSLPDHGTLEELSDGQFVYIADSSFIGLTSFEYEICALQNCEVGQVYINSSHFVPSAESDVHHLTGVKNRQLLINYSIPVNAYSFALSQPATNGVVNIHAGLDTISEGCVVSIGKFMITYTPDSGFEGFDEFTLTYCSGSECHDVVVSVEIVAHTIYDTCHCQDQCIWPGDVNFDGIINMADLLSLGQVVGDIGINRPYPEPDEWYGQFGENWNNMLRGHFQADEKHCDTDGDGYISIADTTAISTFYGQQHTLVPGSEVTIKKYDIGLDHDLVNPPDSGDTITIYITIGSPQVPAKDLSGVAMNISFDPNTVDSSYTRISVVNENWITREGIPLFMNKNNRVNFDLGLSRIDQASHHGYGRVFEVEIIIDDDIDGLRPLGDQFPINIFVHDIVGLDGEGHSFIIPDQQLTLMANIDHQETAVVDESFNVFPNPVQDRLGLDFGDYDVRSLVVTDIQGRIIRAFDGKDNIPSSIATIAYVPGVYIVKAQTSLGVKTAKFLKVR
jgi:hypothetical protein